MPTATEQLWVKVTEKKYAEIFDVIDAHKDEDLINSVKADGKSLFMALATVPLNKPMDVIQTLLQKNTLNLAYLNPTTKKNTVAYVMDLNSPELATLIADNPAVISVSSTKLTYHYVKELLRAAQLTLDSDMKRDPNGEGTKRTQIRVENYKKMLDTVRDATILHAIATDDASLFEQLEQAGAEPNKRLSNRKLPSELFTSNNSKLKAWNEAQVLKLASSLRTNGIYAQEQTVTKQIEQAEKDLLDKKTSIHTQAIDDRLNRISSTMSV